MATFQDVCQAAARIGGEKLLEYRDRFATQSKGEKDFVTDADLASQAAIQTYLSEQYPDHRFVGEEDDTSFDPSPQRDSPYCWIVDPLDGTINYIHQLQSYSVSIALQHQDRIIAAAVYDPLLDEMYAASEDGAATLNGHPIKTSGCRSNENALVVISLPTNIGATSPELHAFLQILYNAQSVRRLGSAALNLCYVACGRVDAYWATSVNLWDIAAGSLIVRNAGGIFDSANPQPLDMNRPKFIAAASSELYDQLKSIINDPAAEPLPPQAEQT